MDFSDAPDPNQTWKYVRDIATVAAQLASCWVIASVRQRRPSMSDGCDAEHVKSEHVTDKENNQKKRKKQNNKCLLPRPCDLNGLLMAIRSARLPGATQPR